MSGKPTSTLERPDTRPSAADRGRSRLSDLSRPIRVDRRISRNRRSNVLLALAALTIAGALAAALFVLPVKTLFNQNEQIAQRTEQLKQLQAVNEDLRSEVARLKTNDGVREAAREQLGFVEPGETRQSILAFPPVPTDLPDGWPYSLVEGIVAIRRNPPAASATTPATPPPTAPSATAAPATTVAPTAAVTTAAP
jgi:cell division protein FtsB